MKKPDWRLWMNNKKECEMWLRGYFNKKVLRKTRDNSKLHLRKTDHNLNFANWVFDKHKDEIPEIFGKETFYDWVINIYYYAIYHTALALMSREGFESKSHSATLCFLIYHHFHLQKSVSAEDIQLIATSLDKEDIETVGLSKELREKASYDIHEKFEQILANDIRRNSIDFANKIKAFLS